MTKRRAAVVGDEESVKAHLRGKIASYRSTTTGPAKRKVFTIDLMDIPAYAELNDSSRKFMRGLMFGYVGAAVTVTTKGERPKDGEVGIRIPIYGFKPTGPTTPHRIWVKYPRPKPRHLP